MDIILMSDTDELGKCLEHSMSIYSNKPSGRFIIILFNHLAMLHSPLACIIM